MSQTDDGMSFIEAEVFVSPDNSAWTDMGPFGTLIAVAGGERATGEKNTFDGDTPILKSGKRASTTVTCRFVYTEESSDAFEIVRTQYELAKGPMYLQYSPKDGFWFKSGLGIVKTLLYPGGEANSGDVVMSEFVLACASLTKADASD